MSSGNEHSRPGPVRQLIAFPFAFVGAILLTNGQVCKRIAEFIVGGEL